MKARLSGPPISENADRFTDVEALRAVCDAAYSPTTRDTGAVTTHRLSQCVLHFYFRANGPRKAVDDVPPPQSSHVGLGLSDCPNHGHVRAGMVGSALTVICRPTARNANKINAAPSGASTRSTFLLMRHLLLCSPKAGGVTSLSMAKFNQSAH